MKKIKIRIVKRKKKDIEEQVQSTKNCYSSSQLEILNKFHREMDELRSEIKDLKLHRQKLTNDIKKKKNVVEPITAKNLFAYCSELNKASKGKFGQKK